MAVIGGYLYFSKDTITFTKETSAYKAVPVSSPVFFEVGSLKSLPLANEIVQQLSSVKNSFVWIETLSTLDTLIKNNRDISNGLRGERFIVAFDRVGDDQLLPVFILKAESSSKRKSLELLFQKIYNKPGFKITQKNYSSFKLITYNDPKNKRQFTYSFVNGLFIGSPKSILVEECLRQINQQSILENSLFSVVNKTADSQSEISCYINHSYFADLLGSWLNPSLIKTENEFKQSTSSSFKNDALLLKRMASWTELDIKVDDDRVSLNGVSTAPDSLFQFFSVLKGQQALRFQADEVLPKNTAYFTSYTISDSELFFKRLEEYFEHSGFYYKREEYFKNTSRKAGDLKKVLRSFTKDEIIVASGTILANNSEPSKYLILHSEGKTKVESILNELLSNYAKRSKSKLSEFKSIFNVDNETAFTIYRFPYYSFPQYWLGKPFANVQAKYLAFNGNYMVFCNSEKGLHDYLYNTVIESTLDKDIRYQQFKQQILSKANITNYVNINRSFNLNKKVFNTDWVKHINDSEEFLRRFYAASWQVVSDGGIYFNTINASKNKGSLEDAQTVWQSNIGNRVISKPFLVVNHTNRDVREIIVQDEKNKLHLLTKDGRVLWSIKINEPIIGGITQVDALKNGKLQYLFNTKSKLFLIDRNGNNVGNFPVSFRAAATNSVSVFDYDNNRNYRFFIACDNRKVYAYNQSGNIITGWKFGQTDHLVTTPIQHFRVNNKDYIVFKDNSRIYIQNRQGATRVKTNTQFSNSKNKLVLNTNGTPKIVATDINGSVYYIYFNGKQKLVKQGKYSKNHFFEIADIDANHIPDFIFVNDNKLEVISENGKKLFEKKFKNSIQNKPNLYSFAGGKKEIGIVDAKANKIYLFKPDGELHEGFPLQGNSEFSIGKIDKNQIGLNLIVGSEGGDIYNYSLE